LHEAHLGGLNYLADLDAAPIATLEASILAIALGRRIHEKFCQRAA
jgi:hypothetical protein